MIRCQCVCVAARTWTEADSSTKVVELGNEAHGIYLKQCSEPVIGGISGASKGADEQTEVVVAANRNHGIYIKHTVGAKIINTRVGTDFTHPSSDDPYGFADRSGDQGKAGICIKSTSGTIIGAPGHAGRVVVAYSGTDGLRIGDELADGNAELIVPSPGRTIGTQITNTIAIKNRGSGISLGIDSEKTIIGKRGSTSERVLLLGNDKHGLSASGAEVAVVNTYAGVVKEENSSTQCRSIYANALRGIYIERAARVTVGAKGDASTRVLASCNGLDGVGVGYAVSDVMVVNTVVEKNVLHGYHIGRNTNMVQLGAAGAGNRIMASGNNVGIQVEMGASAVTVINAVVGADLVQGKDKGGNQIGGIISHATDFRIGSKLDPGSRYKFMTLGALSNGVHPPGGKQLNTSDPLFALDKVEQCMNRCMAAAESDPAKYSKTVHSQSYKWKIVNNFAPAIRAPANLRQYL